MSNITWSKGTQLFSSITDHAVKEQMIKEKEEYLIEMMKMSKRSKISQMKRF